MTGRRRRQWIHYSFLELAWIEASRTRPRRESHADFVRLFKRPDVNLKNYCGLCKRKGWTTGRTGCFAPGHVPANKGKKMPFNKNSAQTQFKKGNRPHNTKYEGHERITKEGYIEISVRRKNPHTGFHRRYVQKHRWLWEKENGRLPAGMCLKCLDGNKQNTHPSNREAIPRSMLPLLNGHRGPNYDKAPPEVKPNILTMAKLRTAISKKKKKRHSVR